MVAFWSDNCSDGGVFLEDGKKVLSEDVNKFKSDKSL